MMARMSRPAGAGLCCGGARCQGTVKYHSSPVQALGVSYAPRLLPVMPLSQTKQRCRCWPNPPCHRSAVSAPRCAWVMS